MDKISYVGNADVSAIDHLYKSYLKDPDSVDIGWRRFFEGFDFEMLYRLSLPAPWVPSVELGWDTSRQIKLIHSSKLKEIPCAK